MTLQHPLYHMSLSYFAQLLPPLRLRDDCEHHLGDVERVPPVVVGEAAVVLLHGAQPAAEDGVVDVEAARKVHVDEHPQRRLQKGIGHKSIPFCLVLFVSEKYVASARCATFGSDVANHPNHVVVNL